MEQETGILYDSEYWFAIPDSIFKVPDLSIAAQMIYIVLKKYVGGVGPSLQTLADESRISVNTAKRAVRELTKKKLLHVEARFIPELDI